RPAAGRAGRAPVPARRRAARARPARPARAHGARFAFRHRPRPGPLARGGGQGARRDAGARAADRGPGAVAAARRSRRPPFEGVLGVAVSSLLEEGESKGGLGRTRSATPLRLVSWPAATRPDRGERAACWPFVASGFRLTAWPAEPPQFRAHPAFLGSISPRS